MAPCDEPDPCGEWPSDEWIWCPICAAQTRYPAQHMAALHCPTVHRDEKIAALVDSLQAQALLIDGLSARIEALEGAGAATADDQEGTS